MLLAGNVVPLTCAGVKVYASHKVLLVRSTQRGQGSTPSTLMSDLALEKLT